MLAGALASYLLTEKPEGVGMAEVLPGVEHLEEAWGKVWQGLFLT